MCGAAVLWGSRLQPSVALSTTEAEYMALAAASQEAMFVRQVLKSLGLKLAGPIKMFDELTTTKGVCPLPRTL